MLLDFPQLKQLRPHDAKQPARQEVAELGCRLISPQLQPCSDHCIKLLAHGRGQGEPESPGWSGGLGRMHLPVSSLPGATSPSLPGCADQRYCHKRSYSLQVPGDILQLPVQLHDFSWKLLVPKDRLSLALVPAQKLQQHTPEKVCNTSFSYLVASTVPGQDLYFGSFCPGGSIRQIQVKQNVSVTLRTFAPSFQQEASRQGLTVSFIPYFKGKDVSLCLPVSLPLSRVGIHPLLGVRLS